MAEGRHLTRYIPSRTGPLFLNLKSRRVEIIATEGIDGAQARTFQSGDTPHFSDNLVEIGELPRRFLETLFRTSFRSRQERTKRRRRR